MALADLCGLPSLLFTLLLTSIAADFQVAVLLARYELRFAALRCAKGPFVADCVGKLAYLENTPFSGYRIALPILRKLPRIAYRRSDFH